MALEDFDTHDSAEREVAKPAAVPVPKQPTAYIPASARKPANPEDEDLFDFPVVEMKYEADASKRPEAPAAAAAAATAATAAAAPATAKPAAPAAPAAAAAPAAKPAQAAKPSAAAKEPAKEPGKAAAATARPQEKKDVAQAAQLVEDIEQVLGADGKAPKRARRLQGPSPLALAGAAALVLTNVLGLFFLWRTTQSYQNGVQAMHEKLVETLRHQTELQSQETPPAGKTPAGGAATRTPASLEAFELVTLQMAREEIQAGEYAEARRRLSRLLAVADRIEAEAREDIEAQASFLIASTYRKQAEAAGEKSP